MKVSKKGLDLIKKHEGFRNHPYLCPAGVPTIGYGNTYYADGRKVRMTDRPITSSEATELLCDILDIFEKGVTRVVTKPITQNQFDALISFTYNLGLGALKSSTLLKKVNKDPNDPYIDFEFQKWVLVNGMESKGLRKRRNQESWLYFTK